MLDEQGQRNLFQSVHDLWIKPELEKRFGEAGTPENFKVREALIKLPRNQDPIVEFNDEIHLSLKVKMADGLDVEPGDLIYLHEVEEIGAASPPTVNDKRVAFVYLYWAGYSYQIVFDFSPNHAGFNEEFDDFNLGNVISRHIKNKMMERTVRLSKEAETQLQKIGLWTITSLLPYPISRIVERIGENQIDEARELLINFCDTEYIKDLISTWKPIKVFDERLSLFQDALFAHKHKKYRLSIHTLVPQIEGVIADWLHNKLDPKDVTWRTSSRIEQFQELVKSVPELSFAYREALHSTIAFLQHKEKAATPFQPFRNWLDTIDPNFPARHAISHGKYVEDIFTEENSIKLFLLLDTICQFMMFYEVRVLGRNLEKSDGEKE